MNIADRTEGRIFQDEKPRSAPCRRPASARHLASKHAAAGTPQSARASLPSVSSPRRRRKRLGGRVWRYSRLCAAAALMFWIAPTTDRRPACLRFLRCGRFFWTPLYRPSALAFAWPCAWPARVVIVFPAQHAYRAASRDRFEHAAVNSSPALVPSSMKLADPAHDAEPAARSSRLSAPNRRGQRDRRVDLHQRAGCHGAASRRTGNSSGRASCADSFSTYQPQFSHARRRRPSVDPCAPASCLKWMREDSPTNISKNPPVQMWST